MENERLVTKCCVKTATRICKTATDIDKRQADRVITTERVTSSTMRRLGRYLQNETELQKWANHAKQSQEINAMEEIHAYAGFSHEAPAALSEETHSGYHKVAPGRLLNICWIPCHATERCR